MSVDDIKVTTPTHEQAQGNPILQYVKGSTFQHSLFVGHICGITDCKHHLCPKPCAEIIQHVDEAMCITFYLIMPIALIAFVTMINAGLSTVI